jgi:Sec-independent protein translocase protein TatA
MTLAVLFDSVGFGEWFMLLAVVLIVVGPRRLPSVARNLGQYYSRFRRAADNFKRQLMDMDTAFDRAAEEATKPVENAFTSDSGEKPADGGEKPADGGEKPADEGEKPSDEVASAGGEA